MIHPSETAQPRPTRPNAPVLPPPNRSSLRSREDGEPSEIHDNANASSLPLSGNSNAGRTAAINETNTQVINTEITSGYKASRRDNFIR